MLAPAVARARAAAGQAACMANVRAVAQAILMCAAENDYTLPPKEQRPEVLAYFNTRPGRAGPDQWNGSKPGSAPFCHRAYQANPYLRWPVILEVYLPDRAVWRCPNARLEGGASFINGSSNWLGHLRSYEGKWGKGTDPYICPAPSYPAGWGGDVTDSLTQRRAAVPLSGKGKIASPGMFLQSIGVNAGSAGGMSLFEVPDPAWYVICADAGATVDSFSTGTLAYPDLCHLECAGPGDWEADWSNCPWSRECGGTAELKTNPRLLSSHTRHSGGVNIGFLDGHAAWWRSEAVLAESPTSADPGSGRLIGYQPGAPTSDASERPVGIPPLY